MTVQQNLRGKPVYGNGSYAPNRGQVSANGAQGYIRREIAKQNKAVNQGPYSTQPVGRDGQSDRRSGVAQAAMGRPGQAAMGRPAPKTKAASVRANPSMGGTGGGRTTQAPAQPARAAYTPNTTQMVVGPTGNLSIAVNSQLAPDVASAYEEYMASLNDQDEQDRLAAIEYQENIRQANAAYEDQQRDTLNTAAGRGVAFSTAYSSGVSKDASDYNNGVNYLNQLNTDNQTTSANRRALYQQAFDRQLQGIMSASAAQDAEDAAAWASANEPDEAAAPAPAPNGGRGWNSGRPVVKPKPKHKAPDPPKHKPAPKPPKGKK